MKITPICLATFLSLPILLHAEVVAPASISVDAATSPGPVNRLVFGHNIEAADTARIFHSDTTDLNSIQTGGGYWDPAKRAPVPAILERAREVRMPLLRYPGGSLVVNFDWRKTVGPIETRGNWKFGIDEYLTFCKAAGAEPMFTVSDYVLPADQMPGLEAGLVEYLNAPATPDHPWAIKRKAWGHPEPYGVKWFELGNESDEGNLRVIPHRHYTPEQYAAYANATAAAMRAVDPTIKIGLVTMPGAGLDADCTWNRTVVHLAGKSVDFLIVHLYVPDIGKNVPEAIFWQGLMASGEQAEMHLEEYRALAVRESGRDLPLAVTEFNAQAFPPKAWYRFAYGEALECADLLRIYLQPEHHVLTASYWEFLNGAFGMLRSDRDAPDGGTVLEKPAYPLYRLWAQHLGTKLATVQVDGPRSSFVGAGSVSPATGNAYVPTHSLGQLPTDGRFDFTKFKPAITGTGGIGGAFALHLDGVTGDTFPQLALIPKPEWPGSCNYGVSFEARFVPEPGSAVVPLGLSVGDARGWPATRSALGISGIGQEWKPFQATYRGIPDTKALALQARLEFGSAKISGQFEVRGLKIEAFSAPTFPTYALLTGCATLSDDGKTLHLIVFNKTLGQDIPATLRVANFHAASARVSEVNGASLAAVAVTETVHDAPLDLSGTDPVHVFPAHSMTAIDFVAQPHSQKP